MDINGMSPERYVASLLLTDSNLKGKEYYRKEDKYTQIIRENASLLFEGEYCSLDWHNEQVMILKDEADQNEQNYLAETLLTGELKKKLKDIEDSIIVECCPECGAENIIVWDVETQGYVIHCSHCGTKMMLCDECIHNREITCECDWNNTTGCFRERKVRNE